MTATPTRRTAAHPANLPTEEAAATRVLRRVEAGTGTAVRSAVRRCVRVSAEDLRQALEVLGAEPATPTIVCTGPGGLEITTQRGVVWETAVLPLSTPAVGEFATATDIAGTTTVGALRAAILESTGPMALTSAAGRLKVGDVDLQPAPVAAIGPVSAPPRPTGGPASVVRVNLPPGLPSGLAMRLDSVNLVVPEHLRARLGHRRCSLTSLYESNGRWMLSAIADGSPMVVIVGEVAVF